MRSWTLVLTLAFAACERDAGEHDEVAVRQAALSAEAEAGARPRDVGVTPAPAWVGYAPSHWLPGPDDPQRRSDPEARAALEARCPTCHAREAEHWQASQHASAWSGAAFQAAFAVEPLPFCQGCHAPEIASDVALAETDDDGSRWAARTGVGCVTCHVETGEARIWTAGEQLEHDREHGCALPISRSPAFAGPQACAACHEFEFPEPHFNGRAPLMQSTVAEHAASAAATRACSDCHMPSERSHAFPGAYDLDMLRRSLEIEARREPDALVLALRPGAVGHAVPTGDLFRRLEITVFALDADGRERLLDRRWLGRRFGPRVRADGLVMRDELGDNRVGPGGRTLRFELGVLEREARLRWRVTHQRIAHPEADGDHAVLEGEIEFASGVVEVP
jgi:hypothetical protein